MISACYVGGYYKVKCDWLIRADVTEIDLSLGMQTLFSAEPSDSWKSLAFAGYLLLRKFQIPLNHISDTATSLIQSRMEAL